MRPQPPTLADFSDPTSASAETLTNARKKRQIMKDEKQKIHDTDEPEDPKPSVQPLGETSGGGAPEPPPPPPGDGETSGGGDPNPSGGND